MQSTKASPTKSYRRASMPTTTTTIQTKRRGSGVTALSSNVSASGTSATAAKSTAVKSSGVKPAATSATAAALSTTATNGAATSPSAASTVAPQVASMNSATTSETHKAPIVLTPVSQIPKGPRRNSRPELPIPEGRTSWDADSFNPDGSLRTMHRMPGFDQSYAQAMKARYCRHRDPLEREKELSVNEIFGRKDTH